MSLYAIKRPDGTLIPAVEPTPAALYDLALGSDCDCSGASALTELWNVAVESRCSVRDVVGYTCVEVEIVEKKAS